MSLFLGKIEDAEKPSFARIVIKDAKKNYKYFGRKTRRVKEPDVINFHDWAKENNVNMGYDESCDTIWFETNIEGDDIVLQGLNTGGQFIRNAIQIAINSGSLRTSPLKNVDLPVFLESDRIFKTKKGKEIRKNGKSSMLVGVQMRMWTMKEGESFEINGGDPHNDDALDWEKHENMFKEISQLFGKNYTLENQTEEEGPYKFKLTRHKDTQVTKDSISCDIYMADQILMAIMGHSQLYKNKSDRICLNDPHNESREITIRFPRKRDYHPDAMVYALRSFGFDVKDTKPLGLDGEELKEWCEMDSDRVVVVKL